MRKIIRMNTLNITVGQVLYDAGFITKSELSALKDNTSELIVSTKAKISPVLRADGCLHEYTLKIDGTALICACGCNVFHHPDNRDLELWNCNCCTFRFETK